MHVVAVTAFAPDSESATVTVSDGRHSCEAFCYPCAYEVGAEITEPLQLFDSTVFMLADQTVARLEHIGPQYQHRGVARVVDKDRGLLEIGALRLEESVPLPGGIETGSVVQFECVRIDLM
jgi:hypothetical protein